MPVYSHSRLSTYENCPLQYRYKYIDRLEPEPEAEGIEAFMGSRVHETLAKLYQDIGLSKSDSLEDILACYDELWDRNWSENVRIARKGYSAENYRDTGRKCIADYYNRYKPFTWSRTLGIEQLIHIDIEGYRLQGFIDRLSQGEDGRYEIHDYKTSQHLPLQRHLDDDRQLALYQVGLVCMWDDVEQVDLVWHYLVHDKEMRSNRCEDAIEKLKCDIVSLIREIEQAEEENRFPANESELCRWCEYQGMCPRHKHILATSVMPPEKFRCDDGVKLVNSYVTLMAEKKELEERLAELKDAIIAYAKQEEVESIRGSDRKLSVRFDLKPKFPTKDDDERALLDALLKKSGKWMDVSDLNVHALARELESAKWDGRLVAEIRKFERLEETCRVTMSKLRENDD